MNTNSFHISRTVGILIAVAVVIIIAISYLVIRKPDEGTVSIIGAPASESEANFVQLAGQLDSITFDTRILTDPRFTSLVDIHTAILPEQLGRTDPFAPIGR